jgi:hypothetical protein
MKKSMFIPVQLGCACIFLSSFLHTHVFAQTIESIKTGSWASASTWNTRTVPSATDGVIVKNGHTVTVNNGQNARQLTINNGGTVVVANPARLDIINGALTVNGTLAINGGSTWTDSSFVYVNGNILVNSGGALTMVGEKDNCCYPQRHSAKLFATGRSTGNNGNVLTGVPVFRFAAGSTANINLGQLIVFKHQAGPANTPTFLSEIDLPATSDLFISTGYGSVFEPILVRGPSFGGIQLESYGDTVHLGNNTGEVLIKANLEERVAFGLVVENNTSVTILGDVSIRSSTRVRLGNNSSIHFGNAANTPVIQQRVNLTTAGGTVFIDNPLGVMGYSDLVASTVQMVRGKMMGNLTANTILGYGPTRYIVGGVRLRNVPAYTSAVFPVGTATHYLPITINSPDGPCELSAGIVPSNTYYPTPYPGLDFQYDLKKIAGGDGIPTVTVQWVSENEKPGFTRHSVQRYYLATNGFPVWSAIPEPSRSATGSNPYSATFPLNNGGVSWRFTFGNSPTVPPCPPTLTLTNSIADNISSGTVLKSAQNNLRASNVVSGNAKVTYQSNFILLQEGSRAEPGTVFKAQIGGCY